MLACYYTEKGQLASVTCHFITWDFQLNTQNNAYKRKQELAFSVYSGKSFRVGSRALCVLSFQSNKNDSRRPKVTRLTGFQKVPHDL